MSESERHTVCPTQEGHNAMSEVVFIFLGRVQESCPGQLFTPEQEWGHVTPSRDLRQLQMALDMAHHTPFFVLRAVSSRRLCCCCGLLVGVSSGSRLRLQLWLGKAHLTLFPDRSRFPRLDPMNLQLERQFRGWEMEEEENLT